MERKWPLVSSVGEKHASPLPRSPIRRAEIQRRVPGLHRGARGGGGGGGGGPRQCRDAGRGAAGEARRGGAARRLHRVHVDEIPPEHVTPHRRSAFGAAESEGGRAGAAGRGERRRRRRRWRRRLRSQQRPGSAPRAPCAATRLPSRPAPLHAAQRGEGGRRAGSGAVVLKDSSAARPSAPLRAPGASPPRRLAARPPAAAP